jgi:hypothetical protein
LRLVPPHYCLTEVSQCCDVEAVVVSADKLYPEAGLLSRLDRGEHGLSQVLTVLWGNSLLCDYFAVTPPLDGLHEERGVFVGVFVGLIVRRSCDFAPAILRSSLENGLIGKQAKEVPLGRHGLEDLTQVCDVVRVLGVVEPWGRGQGIKAGQKVVWIKNEHKRSSNGSVLEAYTGRIKEVLSKNAATDAQYLRLTHLTRSPRV